jgi:hypothetical protein
VQKAIWGDNLPAVKDFLSTAAKVPAASPVWGGMARYLEHRAVFDVLLGGAIFGGGALGEEFSGKHILGPAAILAGVLALHNPAVMSYASNFLKLGVNVGEKVAPATASTAMAPGGEEPAPELTAQQSSAIVARHGTYITEVCDRCGRGIGALRFTRRDDSGVWCSREGRGDLRQESIRRGGRPRRFETNADRQRAYRKRIAVPWGEKGGEVASGKPLHGSV